LKGVNGFGNSTTRDPMQDGYQLGSGPTANFGKDVFSYNLGYFNGDYNPIDPTQTAPFDLNTKILLLIS